jgi:hypothetical protein
VFTIKEEFVADSEDEMEAKLAAGGAEGAAAFVELARSFYELGGSEALSQIRRRAIWRNEAG